MAGLDDLLPQRREYLLWFYGRHVGAEPEDGDRMVREAECSPCAGPGQREGAEHRAPFGERDNAGRQDPEPVGRDVWLDVYDVSDAGRPRPLRRAGSAKVLA